MNFENLPQAARALLAETKAKVEGMKKANVERNTEIIETMSERSGPEIALATLNSIELLELMLELAELARASGLSVAVHKKLMERIGQIHASVTSLMIAGTPGDNGMKDRELEVLKSLMDSNFKAHTDLLEITSETSDKLRAIIGEE